MPGLEAPASTEAPAYEPTADEKNAAKAESIFENNVAAKTEQAEPGTVGEPSQVATSEPETVPMAAGITRVRGLRAGNLAALLAIIAPHAKQLLELIAGFDPAHLQHLLVRLTEYGEIKEQPYGEPAAVLEQRVMVAAGVFEAWSRMTPGTRDDDYSNWINRILADTALRDEFVGLVGHRMGDKPPVDGKKMAEAALAAGIEAPDVLHFADTIAGVIETLK